MTIITDALILLVLLAVAVVLVVVRRGLHREPTAVTLMPTTGTNHQQSAGCCK